MTVYLGRQPILDSSRRRRGYELLYRGGDHESAIFCDPDQATRAVVDGAVLEWGLVNLVGEGTAFVNVTTEFLQSGRYTVLPADRVVLELLETVELDDAAVESVRTASQLGYRFALDDVVSTAVEGLAQILPFMGILKVEVLGLAPMRIRSLVHELQSLAPNAVLLAEKVETIEAFKFCRDVGFELFQGYFFAKPELMRRGSRPISHHAALLILAAVQDPTITIDRLADLANSDPSLAYRLLRLLNVSAIGLTETVRSVRHAIVLLGLDHVCQLATMLAMTANASDNRELITLALTRAHMARQLCAGRPEAADAFTAGLLSVIDALFQTPMIELLADLPVAESVRHALLSKSGPIGEVLALIYAYEQNEILDRRQVEKFGLQTIGAAFANAVANAAQLDRQLEPASGADRHAQGANVALTGIV